jgi:hypothetical protein
MVWEVSQVNAGRCKVELRVLCFDMVVQPSSASAHGSLLSSSAKVYGVRLAQLLHLLVLLYKNPSLLRRLIPDFLLSTP